MREQLNKEMFNLMLRGTSSYRKADGLDDELEVLTMWSDKAINTVLDSLIAEAEVIDEIEGGDLGHSDCLVCEDIRQRKWTTDWLRSFKAST